MKPVTIILPTYCPDMQVEQYLGMCLSALKDNTDPALFDLIVVEQGNAVADSELEYLYVHHRNPLGYAKAVNIGLKLARTKYVCILNNDLFVPPGWLEQMLTDFESVPRCGILAPQEHGGDPGFTYDAHWWSLILTKPHILGLLDEDKLNYRYHDQQKSIEVHKNGYRVVRTGNVVVEHINSATYSKMKVDEGPEREEMLRRWGHAEYHAWVAAQ